MKTLTMIFSFSLFIQCANAQDNQNIEQAENIIKAAIEGNWVCQVTLPVEQKVVTYSDFAISFSGGYCVYQFRSDLVTKYFKFKLKDVSEVRKYKDDVVIIKTFFSFADNEIEKYSGIGNIRMHIPSSASADEIVSQFSAIVQKSGGLTASTEGDNKSKADAYSKQLEYRANHVSTAETILNGVVSGMQTATQNMQQQQASGQTYTGIYNKFQQDLQNKEISYEQNNNSNNSGNNSASGCGYEFYRSKLQVTVTQIHSCGMDVTTSSVSFGINNLYNETIDFQLWNRESNGSWSTGRTYSIPAFGHVSDRDNCSSQTGYYIAAYRHNGLGCSINNPPGN